MSAAKITVILLLGIAVNSYSQVDKATFGLGIGLDYGGFGANFSVYPAKNFGLFGGAGYALAGVGYNVGAKIRFMSETSRIVPFLNGMYGYNTAFVVTNATQYNKFFYGPSVGFGFDFHKPRRNGYLSLGLVIPIRGSDVDNYIADLRSQGIVISNPSPVALSIGYRFILQ
ncbi:MAG TPA: hypothetical protein VKQ08_11765 [Cyclobacteriaceae bacterium]|nr:hypothetical protein [Cyclobacteriaceae bacterium]